jgi:hypothetical protein
MGDLKGATFRCLLQAQNQSVVGADPWIIGDANSGQVRRGPRGRVYTKPEVNELIQRAEDRSDRFLKLFDKALDKGVGWEPSGRSVE